LARYARAHWETRFEGMSRRERRGGSYEAYLADPLSGWELALPGDLAADIADAELAVRALQAAGVAHTSLEGLARFLLRAESVSSSRIEGLDASTARLLREELAQTRAGGGVSDRVAAEILANVAAMTLAVERAADRTEFRLKELLAVHETLMSCSPHPELGGVVRTTQNWIGGSSYNPIGASFVPPPPESVRELLDDLIEYLNGDEHSPLVQAAIAHAQFETIHPFADGNGRAGRALIHVVLRRRGLATDFVPPVSLILATWSRDYVSGLMTFRHTAAADSPERSRAAHPWLRTFASATRRACIDANGFADAIDVLDSVWRERVGTVRRGSSVERLLAVLPGAPLITVASASALIGRSSVVTGQAVIRLVDCGVLTQRRPLRQRYRVFEAREVTALFTSLERVLASPAGNTHTSAPRRRVPDPPGSE